MEKNTKKRVLLLIDHLGSGGAQRQLVELAIAMLHDGYDIKMAYYQNFPFYNAILNKAGVPHELIPGAANHAMRLPRIAKYIRNFAPDTVIAYLGMPSMMACAARKLMGGKWRLIVSERNTTQSLSLRERIKFWLFRYADYVVPNSYAQQAFIAQFFPQLVDKTRVITNMVDMEHFSPAPTAAPLPAAHEMICVGRIVPQKNLHRFLQAVAKVKQEGVKLHIRWYGSFWKGVSEEYYAQLKELDIQDVFEFLEPDSNIVARYREAAVFCLPSVYEGFPNVLCEAMSCGLPVIASRVCDNPQILCDNVNGFLFDAYDVDDMADAIRRIVTLTPERRAQMAAASREISLRLFSSDKFFNKYASLL